MTDTYIFIGVMLFCIIILAAMTWHDFLLVQNGIRVKAVIIDRYCSNNVGRDGDLLWGAVYRFTDANGVSHDVRDSVVTSSGPPPRGTPVILIHPPGEPQGAERLTFASRAWFYAIFLFFFAAFAALLVREWS